MEQLSKTFGKCPLCDDYDRLTEQHIRLVPEIDAKVMICRSCHDKVSRYEGEIQKITQYLKAETPESPSFHGQEEK